MEKSKGLGDTIAKITTATGIKKVVEAITDDCGCKARQDWLNGKVPYNGNVVKGILKFFKK